MKLTIKTETIHFLTDIEKMVLNRINNNDYTKGSLDEFYAEKILEKLHLIRKTKKGVVLSEYGKKLLKHKEFTISIIK